MARPTIPKSYQRRIKCLCLCGHVFAILIFEFVGMTRVMTERPECPRCLDTCWEEIEGE